jgi:hypothetical protein
MVNLPRRTAADKTGNTKAASEAARRHFPQLVTEFLGAQGSIRI